jgi:hypothetical protein
LLNHVWRRGGGAVDRLADRFAAAIALARHRPDIGFMDEPKEPPKQARQLTPEAQRALAEAAERRKQAEKLAPEKGGPAGPEPTRYGDWERKGIAVDF